MPACGSDCQATIVVSATREARPSFDLPLSIDRVDAAQLREVVVQVKGRHRSDVPVVLFGTVVADGKVSAIATANDAAIALGVGANELLAAALPLLGGRGGGKPDLAQGGGTNPEGVAAAIDAVKATIAAKVSS